MWHLASESLLAAQVSSAALWWDSTLASHQQGTLPAPPSSSSSSYSPDCSNSPCYQVFPEVHILLSWCLPALPTALYACVPSTATSSAAPQLHAPKLPPFHPASWHGSALVPTLPCACLSLCSLPWFLPVQIPVVVLKPPALMAEVAAGQDQFLSQSLPQWLPVG